VHITHFIITKAFDTWYRINPHRLENCGGLTGVLSHGEGNPSRGENLKQIPVLQQAGVCREASSLTQENYLAKKSQRGNAGQMILGRPRHVKRVKKELLEDIKRNWKNVAQNRDRWKKVVGQARTLNRL